MRSATGSPADRQELPPIPFPMEDFIQLDDYALHWRALARLVEMLEAPIMVRGRRGAEVSPALARLRFDVAVFLLSLVPMKIENGVPTPVERDLADRRGLS